MRPGDILRDLGLRGGYKDQHFLIDERILNRIVKYADLRGDERVLEIGGGIGNLTRLLAGHARVVYTVELDHVLAEYLREHMPPNVSVIEGDALRVELPEFDKVVANLPYSISSGITFRLLPLGFELGVLMYQLEFAQRMVARVGEKEYGRLSVTAQYYADIDLLEQVPPEAFLPRPEVESAILRVRPRPPPYEVEDEDLFMRVVTAAFTQRRKKLRNGLRITCYQIGLDKERLNLVMGRLPQDILERRPEEISPEEFALVANMIRRECDGREN